MEGKCEVGVGGVDIGMGSWSFPPAGSSWIADYRRGGEELMHGACQMTGQARGKCGLLCQWRGMEARERGGGVNCSM